MTEPKRKGAVRISEIPPAILAQLNAGTIETVNLTEWLAVNQRLIMQNVLPALGLAQAIPAAHAKLDALKKPSQLHSITAIAHALLAHIKPKKNRDKLLTQLIAHPSDTPRCWAAYVIGLDNDLTLADKLTAMRPIAADANAGVREIAWLAVRQDIENQLVEAIRLLTAWTQESDANLRRFASEATRPRGVWCKHLEALKQNPEMGYAILAPLRSDASKYVRDSVANWLNDASKSKPAWVREVCAHWLAESKTPETAYIVRRACCRQTRPHGQS